MSKKSIKVYQLHEILKGANTNFKNIMIFYNISPDYAIIRGTK